MTEQIRPATAQDVDGLADLAELRRSDYARYQPVFWRPATDAKRRHWRFLAKLAASNDAITLVSDDSGRLTGFIIVTFVPAPPVYDPGGLTGLIDDFAVAPGRWPTTGARLLQAALEAAAGRGAVQAVVVTAHLDEPKRSMLRAAGLQLASEWWLAPAG
jgi:hypothetical protein